MSYESDWSDTMEIKFPVEVEGQSCDCDVFAPSKSHINEKRLNILDLTIDKHMERRDRKIDKAILWRTTLIRNTMKLLQEEISEEVVDEQKEFEEFREELNMFESNIDRMMECGVYGSHSSLNNCGNSSPRKRMFEEMEIEDILSQFRSPGIVTCIDDNDEPDMVNSEPLTKRLKIEDEDNAINRGHNGY